MGESVCTVGAPSWPGMRRREKGWSAHGLVVVMVGIADDKEETQDVRESKFFTETVLLLQSDQEK